MKARFWGSLLTASVLLVVCGSVRADGLKDQPKLDSVASKAITAYTREILRTGGDPARARPALLQVVERYAATDLTDNIAGALRDGDFYTAAAATLEDTLAAAPEKNRAFIRFNLARVHLIRASYISAPRSRDAILERASTVADGLRTDSTRDPAADGLRGDIESIRGRVDDAVAAYSRMIASGGSKPEAQYRTGMAYARAHRYSLAEQTLLAAARTPGADGITNPLFSYRAFQELAATYLLDGNLGEAARSLRLSVAKLSGDLPEGFSFRLDVAQGLLKQGRSNADVQAYLEAVLRLTPADEDARTLLARVKAIRR